MQAPPFKGLFARKTQEQKEERKAERLERKAYKQSRRESRKEDRQYWKEIKRCNKGACYQRKGGGYISL